MPISKGWISAWAARYPADYDERYNIDGLAGSEPVFDGVRRVVEWKSNRSVGYFDRNDQEHVEEAVAEALAATDEQQALRLLTRLSGVRERVASAILAVYAPNRYTVMDRRAWSSLVSTAEIEALDGLSWRQTWTPYLTTCRAIATRERVSLRTLDRALYAANGRTALPA